MNFSSNVDALSKENKNLRLLAKMLIATVLIVSAPAVFNPPQPLLIERTSHGLELIHKTPFSRTDEDILHSVELMLKARFNTAAISPELFISNRQLELRNSEQQDLKNKSLSQAIVFRAAKITKAEAIVDFDRILSTPEIRSALKAKVKIAFENVEPNELNPYGLKLALVETVETKE